MKNNLILNKTYHDIFDFLYFDISMKMMQMCGDSIIPPVKTLFESTIKAGHFPGFLEKSKYYPGSKEESKNLVKNFRPISLLPIFEKIFEKFIYSNIFEYFR